MSDEELDALFRRSAAAYPEEMPPAAWAHMETKLATAAHTQQLRRKVGQLFVGELLLIALVLWQVARLTIPAAAPVAGQRQPALSTKTATRVAAATSVARAGSGFPTTASLPGQPTPSAQPIDLGHGSEPAQPLANLAPRHAPALTRVATPPHVATVKTLAKHPPVGKDKIVVASSFKGKKRTVQVEENAGAAQPATQVVARSARRRSRAARRQAAPAPASNPVGTTFTGVESLELLSGRAARLVVPPYSGADSLRRLMAQRPASPDSTPPRRPAPRPAYRVVVGLLAGPSFSGVRTAQTARLGADYGFTLEYRFSARLRLRAGLLSSQKHYQAASTDYQAPAAWHWYAGTYDLAASCRVTEIPLDLRYDVLSRPTYAVFTSLGFNSLLMRDERYSYDWTMSGQTFTKSAQVLNGSNHLLSVLNLAVGFEKALGFRWSAQVEPFWQVPLGGVGAGQVRLTSAGASFSLKYGLLR